MEAERSRLALEENPSALADQIQTVRPAGVRQLNLVVNPVHQRGEVNAEFAYACIGHAEALRLIRRTVEQDAVFHIRLHLPYVGRMRFENVHGVEINLAFVLLRQLVQGGNLPPKWRSGIAPEDQHDGPLGPK